MLVREIPGYYYDETKRKYFRITNGDQRHNAQYSNSQVQAKKRRRKNQKTKKTSKTDTLSQEKFSKLAHQMKYYPRNVDFLLNVRLGLTAIPSGWPLLTALERCDKMITRVNQQSWLLENRDTLICASDSGLTFYDAAQFTKDTSCEPRYVHYWDRPRRVKNLMMTMNWIGVYSAENELEVFRILKDTYVIGPTETIFNLVPNSSQLQFVLTNDRLFTIHNGILSTHTFNADDRNSRDTEINVWDKSKPLEHFIYKCGVVGLAGGKSVTLLLMSQYLDSILKGKPKQPLKHMLSFDKKVHHIYLHPIENDHGPVKFARLTVVTSDHIHIYNLDTLLKDLKAFEDHIKVPITNDNLATPIALHIGEQFLVEMSGSTFNWIDMNRGKSEIIELPCFAKARDPQHGQHWGRNFFFHSSNRFFISSSEGLNELTRS